MVFFIWKEEKAEHETAAWENFCCQTLKGAFVQACHTHTHTHTHTHLLSLLLSLSFSLSSSSYHSSSIFYLPKIRLFLVVIVFVTYKGTSRTTRLLMSSCSLPPCTAWQAKNILISPILPIQLNMTVLPGSGSSHRFFSENWTWKSSCHLTHNIYFSHSLFLAHSLVYLELFFLFLSLTHFFLDLPSHSVFPRCSLSLTISLY